MFGFFLSFLLLHVCMLSLIGCQKLTHLTTIFATHALRTKALDCFVGLVSGFINIRHEKLTKITELVD